MPELHWGVIFSSASGASQFVPRHGRSL